MSQGTYIENFIGEVMRINFWPFKMLLNCDNVNITYGVYVSKL